MPKENISNDSKKKVDYPLWLYEIFYKFSLIYSLGWTRLMPTEVDKQALMKIYYDSLNKFNEETISEATIKYLSGYKYPELHQLISLCEEISGRKRYKEYALEYFPSEKKELNEEAKKAIQSIRNFTRACKK